MLDLVICLSGTLVIMLLTWQATRAAYRNGVADGYGYSQEPDNPGYAEVLPIILSTSLQRWVQSPSCVVWPVQDNETRQLGQLAREQAVWSQATFGSDAERGPLGALKHLEKEAREAQASPTDPTEYADCLLLVLDAARRAGLTTPALLEAAYEKLQVCKQRAWAPVVADEAVEHIREAAHGDEHIAEALASQAAKAVAKEIRRAMAECRGTELQRLKVFATMLYCEMARVEARIEELDPDEWGL